MQREPTNKLRRGTLNTAPRIEELTSLESPAGREEFGVVQFEIRYSTPKTIDLLTVWKKGNKYKNFVVTKKGKAKEMRPSYKRIGFLLESIILHNIVNNVIK